MQRGHRWENEIGHIRGKTCFTKYLFRFGYRSYTDLRDKLYYISGAPLCLFRAVTVIFLGLHTVRFSRWKPCWYCLRFLRMCHEKEKRKQLYLLPRLQKIINFCDKMVLFNFEIVLFSKGLYFHPCKRDTESHGKYLIFMIFAQTEL